MLLVLCLLATCLAIAFVCFLAALLAARGSHVFAIGAQIPRAPLFSLTITGQEGEQYSYCLAFLV
jgi:hypothetical protein